MLNYTGGDRCHQDHYERNTVIEFVCGDREPMYILENMECTYYIRFHTPLACESQFDCSVHGTSLTSLIKTDDNYIATNSLTQQDDPDAAFYLDLCRPLNPIPGTLCPAGAGACMVSSTGTPLSLGRMITEPLWDNQQKKAVVEYSGGDACPAFPFLQLTASIIFICQPGPDLGEPELVAINRCEYEFEWRTNAVCTGKDTINGCTFTDSSLGYTFDFSPLSKTNEAYTVSGLSADEKYLLNICGTAQGCDDDVSICQSNDKTVYGTTANQTFISVFEGVKLVLGSGADCDQGGKRTSAIIFQCDEHSDGSQGPVFEWTNGCVSMFRWKTTIACPPIQKSCVAANGNAVFDLDLLSRSHGSWQAAESSGFVYWFNLCQSVHNVPGCDRWSAMCRTSTDGTVTSLGRLETQEISYNGDHIMITYTDGDKVCKENSKASQVRFHLHCGKTIGTPKLDNKTDDSKHCLFEFIWTTKLACEEEREKLEIKDWVLKEPITGEKIDLNKINTDINHGDHKLNDYVINLIDSDSKQFHNNNCKQAAICDIKNNRSMGDRSTAKYYFEGDTLEAVYTTNTACDLSEKSYVSSVVDFICPSEHENSMERDVVFEYKSQKCVYVFHWYTNEVCLNITSDVSSSDSQHSHSGHHTNTAAIVVSVLLCLIIALIVGILLRNPDRRAACTGRVRRVFGRGGSLSYRYSQLLDGSGDRTGLLGTADQSYGSSVGRDSDDDIML